MIRATSMRSMAPSPARPAPSRRQGFSIDHGDIPTGPRGYMGKVDRATTNVPLLTPRFPPPQLSYITVTCEAGCFGKAYS